jgi:O-antigen/teichoic acid export membrane protein
VFTILGILAVIQKRLDWLLVYGWLSAAELANYAVAYRLYEMIQGILGIGYGMIYVWLCRVGPGEQSDRLLSLARVTMFGGVCISWAGVLAGPEALRLLWGMKYASAELLVRLLLGTATLSAIIGLFYYIILIEGREARLLPIAVVATSLQVLFDLMAIPTMGVLGAAFGTSVLILSTGLGYVLLIRESARTKTMGIGRILCASSAQFVIGWILLLSVPGPGWRLVLLLVCSLGCGYWVLLDARERMWFRGRFAGVWHEMLMGQSGRGSE